jgi:hypothetical protein
VTWKKFSPPRLEDAVCHTSNTPEHRLWCMVINQTYLDAVELSRRIRKYGNRDLGVVDLLTKSWADEIKNSANSRYFKHICGLTGANYKIIKDKILKILEDEKTSELIAKSFSCKTLKELKSNQHLNLKKKAYKHRARKKRNLDII